MNEIFCPFCGTKCTTNMRFCAACGGQLPQIGSTQTNVNNISIQYQQPNYSPDQQSIIQSPQNNQYQQNYAFNGKPAKDRFVAAILALILGDIGVHKFYLGKIGQGLLYLCFCWTGIPAIIGIIEGIIYLLATDEEFRQKYM